jgi:phosphotransferase system  glucose/maltose/N-acetylglucosamine-specific IIC component
LADAQTFILKLEFRMNFVNGNLNETLFFFLEGKSFQWLFFLGGKIITKLLLCVMQWLVYKKEKKKKKKEEEEEEEEEEERFKNSTSN